MNDLHEEDSRNHLGVYLDFLVEEKEQINIDSKIHPEYIVRGEADLF